jgi:hypothetical protein
MTFDIAKHLGDTFNGDEITGTIDEYTEYGANITDGELEVLMAHEDLAKHLEDEFGDDWVDRHYIAAGRPFQDYAEELASDIGAIDRNANWPLMHIDWKEAAEDLSQDYSLVTVGTTDYYTREP